MLDTETEEANHSDSTESAVEDPLETCEKNLLNHIFRVQEEISKRMDQIEEQVACKCTRFIKGCSISEITFCKASLTVMK